MEGVAVPLTYAIERNGKGVPYVLARVQWPDVSEYISPTQSTWTTNRYYFEFVYNSDGEWISPVEADRIAQSWGTTLD